jgi:hypothetical protein
MPEQYFCPRCARPAVRGDSATEEIWRCPAQHGIVYQAALPETPPETQAAAAPPEPDTEHEKESGQEEESGEKEDAKPEARARAPAALRRLQPPAHKIGTMPKKK